MEQNIFEHVAAHRAQVARNVANIFGQEGPTIDNIEKSLDCISAIEMDRNVQANFGNSDFRNPNSPLYNVVRDVSDGTMVVNSDNEEAEDIEKGGKRANLGEIRTYKNGRKYQKTDKGWVEVKESGKKESSKDEKEKITVDHITGFVEKLKNGNYDSNSTQGKFIEDLSEQDGIDGWETLQQRLALDGRTIKYNNNEDRYEVKGGVGVD